MFWKFTISREWGTISKCVSIIYPENRIVKSSGPILLSQFHKYTLTQVRRNIALSLQCCYMLLKQNMRIVLYTRFTSYLVGRISWRVFSLPQENSDSLPSSISCTIRFGSCLSCLTKMLISKLFFSGSLYICLHKKIMLQLFNTCLTKPVNKFNYIYWSDTLWFYCVLVVNLTPLQIWAKA